jgi:hypothetical protein
MTPLPAVFAGFMLAVARSSNAPGCASDTTPKGALDLQSPHAALLIAPPAASAIDRAPNRMKITPTSRVIATPWVRKKRRTARSPRLGVAVKWKAVEYLADDIIDSETGPEIVEANRKRLEQVASALFDARGVDQLEKSREGKSVVFVEAGDLD